MEIIHALDTGCGAPAASRSLGARPLGGRPAGGGGRREEST